MLRETAIAALLLANIDVASAADINTVIKNFNDLNGLNGAAADLKELAIKDPNSIDELMSKFAEITDASKPALAKTIVDIGPSAIGEMSEGLKNPNEAVRRFSAQVITLAGTADDGTLVELTNLLKSDSHEEVRGAAAEAIRASKASSKVIVDALAEALKDESQWVRCVAVESLGNLGQAAAAHLAAIEMISASDPDAYVRDQARISAEAINKSAVTTASDDALLIQIKDYRAKILAGDIDDDLIKVLGTTYLSSGIVDARVMAEVEALVPGYITAHRPEPKAKMIARGQLVEAFRDMGPEAVGALPYLVIALQDDAPWIRAVAAETIGNIGKPAAVVVPQLSSLLDDGDQYVKQRAEAALKQIISE